MVSSSSRTMTRMTVKAQTQILTQNQMMTHPTSTSSRRKRQKRSTSIIFDRLYNLIITCSLGEGGRGRERVKCLMMGINRWRDQTSWTRISFLLAVAGAQHQQIPRDSASFSISTVSRWATFSFKSRSFSLPQVTTYGSCWRLALSSSNCWGVMGLP